MSTGINGHWLQLFAHKGNHPWRATIDQVPLMKK
ncbi:UNVERIFIED_ORG: hypothetical protein J2W82_000421 [Pseudomonas mohnii]|jgi:hypothetical protein|nr:hypothetical protein [Pseudomonas mohnii]